MYEKQIQEVTEELEPRLYEVSQYIGANPELGGEEFLAQEALVSLLRDHGFSVHTEVEGQPETAFTAVKDSGRPGAAVGFMCEYDALPEIGHACGHHLIGTQGAAAAIAASSLLEETGGAVYVYGTPAEETNGAKVTMAEDGMFDHLDAAMMAHPSSAFVQSGSSLAMDAVEFSFHGRTSHAAAAPEEGINALDAVIQTFNAVNALRQHVTPDVRMHGVIPNGGSAANVVPAFASAQFYVRAATRDGLNPVTEKVKNCARAAATATGAELEIRNYEYSYDDMQTNRTLSTLFTKHLQQQGVRPEEIHEQDGGSGSIDMGNVSQRCPAIHPYIRISRMPITAHTTGFRDAALSREGFDGMLLGVRTLAGTAADILANDDIRQEIRNEFDTATHTTV
ncbi:M20 family metallopeptidase [Alkalicoccus chagannorensis]|uniref:M20 family metallopeptidase n=1 Tax=Alkalicoccus chagannorensis TaxID=427072 RepID=UPI0003FE17C6|nr:M20 family metallopeptidase [Alkalicoccus chagannorensis]